MEEIIQIEFNKETAPAGFEVTRIEQKQRQFGEVMAQHGRHEFYMIMFITQGIGKHNIDFVYYELQKGDLVFLSKGQVQAFERSSKLKGFGILFTEEYLSKFSGQSSIIANHRLFNCHLNSPVLRVIGNEQFNEFLTLFAYMESEFNKPASSIKNAVIYHQLQILLLKSDEIHKQRLVGPVSQELYEKFVEFKSLVELHLKKVRKVSFYATEMGLSTKRMNNITKQLTGQNTKDYLNAQCILEIKRILISSNRSIKEISFEMGFEEPTNMVKFFKKYTALTPNEFQKKLR